MAQETLTIERCPLCGQSHVYDVKLVKSPFDYFKAPPPQKFTRLFTCPTKGATFQSTITVSGEVEDVKVEDVHPAA
jgi:transcription elongation factor Elf1